jgi:hypothetical protein
MIKLSEYKTSVTYEMIRVEPIHIHSQSSLRPSTPALSSFVFFAGVAQRVIHVCKERHVLELKF